MKVYELMQLLSDLPAGQEIDVHACLTAKELTQGEEVDTGLFSLHLKIAEVYEGSIGVEV